jgi:hypothetical protein
VVHVVKFFLMFGFGEEVEAGWRYALPDCSLHRKIELILK